MITLKLSKAQADKIHLALQAAVCNNLFIRNNLGNPHIKRMNLNQSQRLFYTAAEDFRKAYKEIEQ